VALLAFTALNFAALQLVATLFLPNGLFAILAADLPFDDETEPYFGSRPLRIEFLFDPNT
jgi:hypothetical protein